MEYDKQTDNWIGTPIEHLKKLLETHDCMCDKVREVIKLIIKSSQTSDKEKEE